MKASPVAFALVLSIVAGVNLNAFAGPNDFFGSQIGGPSDTTQGSTTSPAASAADAQLPAGAPAGDYTADEKRVQKKYKDNMKSAQKLVAKGESMMRSKDEKVSKKGRILKEIGEKRIAELKANNPFPEIAAKDPKKLN
jgi:hypothetical protein